MKTSTRVFGRLFLVGIVCAFATSNSINAQEVITNAGSADSGNAARLVVNRAANFGNYEWIDLFVDGNQVAVLGYNESYDAALSAGKHVLSITTEPGPVPLERPEPVTITAEPGKTYPFTAIWRESQRAGLVSD